jgi:hypothetical protein
MQAQALLHPATLQRMYVVVIFAFQGPVVLSRLFRIFVPLRELATVRRDVCWSYKDAVRKRGCGHCLVQNILPAVLRGNRFRQAGIPPRSHAPRSRSAF